MKIAEKIVVLLLTICMIFTSMPTCVLAETIKSIAETESKQEVVLDEESETNPKGNTATEAGKSYAINENVATEESQSPVIDEGEEDATNGGQNSATDNSEETSKNEGKNSITDNNENDDVDEGKVSGTGESEKDVTEEGKSPITDKNEKGETEENQNPVTDENEKNGTDESKNSATDENEKDVVEKNEDSVTNKNEKDTINKDKHSSTDEEEKSGEDDKLEEEKESEEIDEDSEESESTSENTEESENNESVEETIKLNKIVLKTRNTFINKLIYDENGEDWDNALHFIIRHWHSVQKIKNEEFEDSEESGLNFVVIEGYIVPKSVGGYQIYIEGEDGRSKLENSENYSEYIDTFNNETGTITLKATPLDSNGTPLEIFSAFSVTAGHKAIEAKNEEKKAIISYLPYVHLVKVHAFYVNESIMVVGGGTDDAVFGSSKEQKNKEQDTAWVYTYTKDVEINGDKHKIGEIVKNNGETVDKKENLPEGLSEEENVKLTKVYSTLEGLHTDKTASKIDGKNRQFTIDLESWFSGAKAASIGLLLDASGSMVFTSDPLKPININDGDLNLTQEQKDELMNKALSTDDYGDESPTTDEWEDKIFLTQEEVNEILNTHNTDNNPLSDSDYNYFVFNESDDVNEYAPLGYWDGSLNNDLYDSLIGYYEFNRGDYPDDDNEHRDWLKNSVTGEEASLVEQIDCSTFDESEDLSFQTAQMPDNWKTDSRINMQKDKGLTIKDYENGVGILLDAKPTTSNFTISFTIAKEKDGDKGTDVRQNYTDLVYIGPLDDIKSSNYYRAVRDGSYGGGVSGNGNSKGRLKGFQNELTSSAKTNINSAFSETPKRITIVISEGMITSYMDGAKQGEATSIELTGNNIVIAGFDNGYNGANLHIDDICVFDTALSETDVKKIASTSTEKEYLAYNTFEGKAEEEKIAYVDGSFVEPVIGGMDGWYYVNHDSHGQAHYFNESYETAKVLWGVTYTSKTPVTYTDEFTIPTGVDANVINTKYTYTPEHDSPSLFYIDEEGYLCCFFARGTQQKQAGTSLVYKKDDSEYIKVEALQRAIGSFASKLDEASPDSQVSAVRYSLSLDEDGYTANDEDYDRLVLLDWTTDPADIQSMMSLNYGTGGTLTGTKSNPEDEDKEGIDQYNYGITGGTVTYTGFKAFSDNLNNRVDPDSEKYLIVFTDGKDTSNETQQAEIKTMAEKLKTDGYTIMAVMLTGGTIEYSIEPTSEYQKAKEFLLSFVGTSDTKETERQNYFFSTAEIGLSDDGKNIDNQEANNIDKLTEIFTNDLLERIADNLQSYSIQDYIDPRFNLVSATGKEYKLDANGIVTILDTDGTTYAAYNLIDGTTIQEPPAGVTLKPTKDDSSKKYYLNTLISTDIDVDVSRARLYFDADKNMYYLKWVDQTIPGCVPDASRLSVWNTRFTIKAKDDVIGGNAILTNGNGQNMNWVYSEEDNENASSGTDDCIRTEDNELVSKGFPRVTVNIPPYDLTRKSEQTIYMGENLSYKDIKEEMIKQVNEKLEDKDNNIKYYWEYLDRYKGESETAEQYIEELIEGETITIPYYYLPDKDHINLTGSTEKHEKDELGELVYKIEVEGPDEGVIKDRQERKFTLTVTYKPKPVDERSSSNDTLVTDDVYKWNKTYKPDVGELQNEKTVIKNEHKIDIVSGEIALQVVFDSKVAEVIDGQKIVYQMDLYRTYNEEESKVGTFTATYGGTEEMQFDELGNFILTAKLDCLEDYMDTDGLPLGTYTVRNPHIVEAPSYIKFDEIGIVEDREKYEDELFTVGSGEDTPQEFLAAFKTDTNSIILGENSPADGYLNKRFGLYAVKPIAAFEMPVAGNNSLIMLYATAIACIMIATMLHISIKIRKKRK